MPIISGAGRRSTGVRALYTAIYAVLALGVLSMVYPFLIMLVGSTASNADIAQASPYPVFWFDDTVLFRKYVESKYNGSIQRIERSWKKEVMKYSAIEAPERHYDSSHLEAFLDWRKEVKEWTLGHCGAMSTQMQFPHNARTFRQTVYAQFEGDVARMRAALGVRCRNWGEFYPPVTGDERIPSSGNAWMARFREFAATRPVHDRIIPNPDGNFWCRYLTPRYTQDIGVYNAQHKTNYQSYDQVWLAERVPRNPLEARDWEDYVRKELYLSFLRIDSSQTDAYRAFLRARYNGDIGALNERYATRFDRFDDVPFTSTLPGGDYQRADWGDFVASPGHCDVKALRVAGPRQDFESFVAAREGVPRDAIAPLAMPLQAADWHDTVAHAKALRLEFTLRNYRHVLEYLWLHGRGIVNTVIYCALAVGTALTVNPLAAYALSRYRPPATYTLLLLCMAVMAFPAEVTMIPSFILLKNFPLFPLITSAFVFLGLVWSSARLFPQTREALRVGMALFVAVIVGFWWLPSLAGDTDVSLLNSFWALVLPTMANGFSIFLLKGFFDSLPRELYESAEIDGAGEWTKFWTITMNLSKPILAVIALNAFVAAYSAFMMALIVIPDQKMWTLMVWIFQLQAKAHQSVVYASLVIAALPTLLVFLACQRFIIRGIIVPSEK